MEGTWSQRPEEGVVGVRNAILYRTRGRLTHPLAVAAPLIPLPNLFMSIYPSVPLPLWAPSRFPLLKGSED